MPDDPAAFYSARIAHFNAEAQRATQAADRMANVRLAVFGVGLAAGVAAWMGHASWWWLVLPVAAFGALMAAHESIHRRRARAETGAKVYTGWMAAMRGEPSAYALESALAIPSPHLYARDLDLFGRGGLFELLCRARTLAGAQTLAEWLLAPAAADTVALRQEAARELIARHDLRENLALNAGAIDARISARDLRRWAEEPIRLGTGPRKVLAFALIAWSIAAIPLALTGFAAAPIIALAMNIGFLFSVRDGFVALNRSIEPISRELHTLASVLALFEKESFTAPLLREESSRLIANGQRASDAVRSLDRLISGFEMYLNQLFGIVALYTLWPYWWGWAIERWRARHHEDLEHIWMEALGRLEALCSIAAYAYERPADAWPEILSGPPAFEAKSLGHPLLPPDQRVRNDLQLGPDARLLMVSGSNMSGKSTLLRAVGINTVLAHCGAPVCAESLRLSPLQTGAIIRVEDSIQRGASRFYAEIERFRAVFDSVTQPTPVLFLADEILHGTNTRDRVSGARALIRALLERGAIGLVTTHDLALTDFVSELNGARNVHFEDRLVEGRLSFDYTLREGVVTRTNALDLMRSIGLPVEE